MNAIRQRTRRFQGRFADIGIALVAIIVAVILLVGALGMEVRGNQVPGPTFFPLIISGLLFVVGIVLLVSQIRASGAGSPEWHRPDVSEDMLRDLGANTELLNVDEAKRLAADERAAAAVADEGAAGDPETAHPVDWRTVGIVVGAVVFFIVTLELIGWIFAAAALFWIVAFAFGSKRYLFNAGVALMIASIVQLLFVGALGLTLPSGFLGVFV